MIHIALIMQALPYLLHGAFLSLVIAGCSSMIGVLLGTLLGVVHAQRMNILTQLTQVYVTLIRGTPMLIQITFIYYVLPVLGITLSALATVIIALGINSGAYVSQIIRSGIQAVGAGPHEAGLALGLSKLQIMRFIILPQAFRIALPSLGNECVTLIKDSSLASTIGVIKKREHSSAIHMMLFHCFL